MKHRHINDTWQKKVQAYWHIYVTALRQKLASPMDLISRVLLFLIIMSVFTQIWSATADAADVWIRNTWYLMATEWVVLSIPYTHIDIEAEVRSGDAAFAMLRPCSWVGMHLARSLGAATGLWLVLGVSGFVMTRILTGQFFSEDLWTAIPVAQLALVSIFAGSAANVAIGISAWWLTDATPVAWVWQKLMFVLGGLILPLSIYPEWLQVMAKFTPFPAMIFNIGDFLVAGKMAALPGVVVQLGLWSAGIFLVLAGASRAAEGRVESHGA